MKRAVWTESVLHSFAGSSDGATPWANLIDVNGTLYGTTVGGGGSGCYSFGCGTVFAITKTGTKTILHTFTGGADGVYPESSLTDVNGTLYGTTEGGGVHYGGTVFSITASGVETVLHSFNGGSEDGEYPTGGLLNINGTLYGTTKGGGAHAYGTVFKITTSGTETVLHSFAYDGTDGIYPVATLTNAGSKLMYGTTTQGGADGDGTVFAITTSGTETILHAFAGSTDGAFPEGSLTNVNGTYYGTTANGGGSGCGNGCGVVFSITTSGSESVLHSFAGSSGDGAKPYAGLTDVSGTLYGTTQQGGENGDGTVFSITTSGSESVLYSFAGGDGADPYAGVTNISGTLYGTTTSGGTHGDGTVFALANLPLTESVLHTFDGGSSDGAVPAGEELLNANGAFYGVTREGGGTGCGGKGCGTVFTIGASGAESILYSFQGGTKDGSLPHGGLVVRDGVLYGTTQGSGKYGGGTFFKITFSGKETVLHNFGAATGSGYDGYDPYGEVIYVSGKDTFYGTTIYGGTGTCYGGCGTVFSVTPSGKETLLHSFQGGQDGDFLTGSLLYDNGQLYGTTQLGGSGTGSLCSSTSSGLVGCGTIFSVSTSGTEKIVYSFTGGADGGFPDAGLIDVNGTLYGMTGGGGGGSGCANGCGTIFGLSPSGALQAIHAFAGPPNDGAGPFGNLTNIKGVLYGATQAGGSAECATGSGNTGCGALFRVTTSGKEQMLYSFQNTPDGAVGQTTMIDVSGVLYGTTVYGGLQCNSNGKGCGTVFTLSGF